MSHHILRDSCLETLGMKTVAALMLSSSSKPSSVPGQDSAPEELERAIHTVPTGDTSESFALTPARTS